MDTSTYRAIGIVDELYLQCAIINLILGLEATYAATCTKSPPTRRRKLNFSSGLWHEVKRKATFAWIPNCFLLIYIIYVKYTVCSYLLKEAPEMISNPIPSNSCTDYIAHLLHRVFISRQCVAFPVIEKRGRFGIADIVESQ